MVRNTYIYPPGPSMRIVADIIEYTARHMPKFNSISISGYHMEEAGATCVQELAFTLADGLEYVRAALSRGLDDRRIRAAAVVLFRHRHEFLHGDRQAARRAAAVGAADASSSAPKNPASLALRTHCQTSGVSLTEQDPHNNIVRTTIEAMAAVLGGTQSLHTNSFDEAHRAADPVLDAHRPQHPADPRRGDRHPPCGRPARRQLLRREPDRIRSPTAATALIDEVEALGGMTKAVEAGMPKLRIEEAAARRQAAIDRGEESIVGVNKYRSDEQAEIDLLDVDNSAVRDAQIARLDQLRRQPRPGSAAQPRSPP